MKFLRTPFASKPRYLRLSTAWGAATWPRHLRRRSDAILTFEMGGFTKFLRRFLKPGGMMVGMYAGEAPSREKAAEAMFYYDALVVENSVQLAAFRRSVRPDFPIAVAPLLGHYAHPPARAPFSGGVLRVGFLGRFDRPKGVHRLLEIWPRLNIGPAELHFYGGGPEKARMCAAISDRRFRNVFVHGGWSEPEELQRIFSEVDLLVLPSESEGLPVVLLESMAHGVPFVASDVGAIRTLTEGNPDVAVVPLDDAQLTAAINRHAKCVREASVIPSRLQRYFEEKYGFHKTSELWVSALLNADAFWKGAAAGNATANLHQD